MWMKDGMVYHGDGDRVRVDHKGIVFSNVVSEDYGRYTVMSRNRAGIGSAYTVLKGLDLTVCSPYIDITTSITGDGMHIIIMLTALGVLCCLFDLACFFLPSFCISLPLYTIVIVLVKFSKT